MNASKSSRNSAIPRRKPAKSAEDAAIKFTISMPTWLREGAETRMQSLGYASLSAYFQGLVHQDLISGSSHVRKPGGRRA